ncbi:MAG TPA: septum formation initiator family protein [Acidimicrobiia bacterium]|nr:septum formation initiator family protein [Acidimicrobiia bacterium]
MSVRRLNGRARVAIATLVTVASLFLFVFPTQALLAQQRDVRDAKHDLAVLREQNDRLAEEAARLETPEEIERMAREQYGMVRPGEDAYAVIPPSPTATTTTTATGTDPADG